MPAQLRYAAPVRHRKEGSQNKIRRMLNLIADKLDRANPLTRDIAVAVFFVCASGVVALGLLLAGITHVSMIFLSGVLFSAVIAGTRAAILTAALAFFVYDYFWLPPVFTFTITTPEEAITLAVFFLVAVVTGWSSGGLRDRKRRADLRARTLLALVQDSEFFVTQRQSAIRQRLAEAVTSVTRTGAVVLTPGASVVERAGVATAWRGPLERTVRALGERALYAQVDQPLIDGSFRARPLRGRESVLGAVVWLAPDASQGTRRECDDYVAILSEVAAAALARAAG